MRRTKILAIGVGVIVAGGLLAACGDDDDNSAATTTAAPAATTAPAAAKDIVDTAVGAGSFTTLASLLTEAGLVDTLKGAGPFTVFAPTDEAFAAVPKATLDALAANPDALKQVLTYHVVSGNIPSSEVTTGMVATVEGSDLDIKVDGGTVMVNDATVVTPDVAASNGVIHVIDAVLLPADLDLEGGDAMAPTTMAPTTTAAASQDIVATAVGAGQFTTLAKLLTDAGLVSTLQGAGPFTVFAPTDEAFAKVPQATLDALAGNPELLKKVLTYHVLAGRVASGDITPGSVATVAGDPVDITVENGKVMVNGATVVSADVVASNGVIHVIDTVLLPPGT